MAIFHCYVSSPEGNEDMSYDHDTFRPRNVGPARPQHAANWRCAPLPPRTADAVDHPGARQGVFTQKTWVFWAEIHGVSGHFNVFSYFFMFFHIFHMLIHQNNVVWIGNRRLSIGQIAVCSQKHVQGDFAALSLTHISEMFFRNG